MIERRQMIEIEPKAAPAARWAAKAKPHIIAVNSNSAVAVVDVSPFFTKASLINMKKCRRPLAPRPKTWYT